MTVENAKRIRLNLQPAWPSISLLQSLKIRGSVNFMRCNEVALLMKRESLGRVVVKLRHGIGVAMASDVLNGSASLIEYGKGVDLLFDLNKKYSFSRSTVTSEVLGTIIAPDYHSSNNKTCLTRSSFSRLLPSPLFLSPNILAPS